MDSGGDELDLVGLTDIQAMLAVSRGRTDQITREKGFPEPVYVRPRIRLWRRRDVEAWIERNRPPTGS